jgi:hypothetical protein
MFSYRTGVRSMEMTDEMREYLFNLTVKALEMKLDFAFDNLFEAIDRTGYYSRETKEAIDDLTVAHAASSLSSSSGWAFLYLMDELPPFNPQKQSKRAEA